MMKGIVISMLVVLAMAHLMVQQGEAVVNCGQVDSNLAPCVSYLTKRGSLDPACCAGVKNIKNLAQTTADKQAACECCKAAANSFPNVDGYSFYSPRQVWDCDEYPHLKDHQLPEHKLRWR